MISIIKNNLNDEKKFLNDLSIYLQKNKKLDLNLRKSIISKDIKEGHSGSKLLITENNNILKLYNLKTDNKPYIKDNCLFIKNNINEILINLVIRNLHKLTKITKAQDTIVKAHTIPIIKYGISKNKQYILMKKIGLTYDNKIYTNLNELFTKNHIPWLLNNLDNDELVVSYDKMMVNQFDNLFKAIYILQRYVKYINTDNKMDNIFIKRTKINDNELQKSGCITNFKLLISDLDKANISINNLTIIPKGNIINKIFVPIRYKCHNYQYNDCKNLNIFDFDILILIFNFYMEIYRTEKIHNVQIIDKLPLIYSFFQKQFNFSMYKYNKLFNIIKKYYLLYRKNIITTYIIYLVNKYCKNYLK